MRILVLLLLTASPAAAHVGHIGTSLGHDHWVAGIAIGAAIALAAWQALKGEKAQEDADADSDADAEETPA